MDVETQGKKILIIMPAYNEADCIGNVIDNIKRNAPFADIVVVNDGSLDKTGAIAKTRGAVVLNLPYNMGIGGAVQTGYVYAKEMNYDIALQVDADGQHPAKEIPKLVNAVINDKADLVIGSRYMETSDSESVFTRAVGKWILAKVLTLFTRQRITDCSSGFRAMNTKAINLFSHIYPRDYPEPESIAFLVKEGLRVKEIPVKMNGRVSGQSSISFIAGIYYVIKVILAIFIDQFECRVTGKGYTI